MAATASLLAVQACAGGEPVIADGGPGAASARPPDGGAMAAADGSVSGPAASPPAGASGAAAASAGEPCIALSRGQGGGRGPSRERLRLTAVAFGDLPGWADDSPAEAVPAFRASCKVLAALPDDAAVGVDGSSGRARDWRAACAAAATVPDGDAAAARAFFEAEFTPWAAAGDGGASAR